MTLKNEMIADVRRRQQRLRELRDMTQDREERVRLDEELATMQVTLSDLADTDEDVLRRQRALRRLRAASKPTGALALAAATFTLAVLAGSVFALLRARREAR